MALYAFDGTWNAAKETEEPTPEHTNVFRFFQAYRTRSGTHDFYLAGVGTRFDLVGRALGGAFGLGELSRILEAYDHLCAQWAAGDTIIDIVGFSRGAATTLDFIHHVMENGIRRPGTSEVIDAQPTIRFLGVWDTVGAFGLANLGNTALNIGHHLSLPKANLRYGFHALALDERRPSFLPTRLPGAREVWFRGAHSDVGGGNGNVGLNDIALRWMLRKAKGASLPIEDADITALTPDPEAAHRIARQLPVKIRLIGAVDRRHYTVSPVDGLTDPPPTCPVETESDEAQALELSAGGLEVLPPEVRRRIAALWETAEATATANGFTLEQVREPLLTLFQARIPLVTNEAELTTARQAVSRLMLTAIHGARQRNFHVLAEFFLNEALFELPRLFPLTD